MGATEHDDVDGEQVERAKADWRRRILGSRRALDPATRDAEAARLAGHAGALAAGCVVSCAYVPVGSEPGSLQLLAALVAAGSRVLLPVARGPGVLDWAEFTEVERLVAGRYGLREPAGKRLGAAAVGTADLVLLPALAVDRAGNRLGRGAGYYDRSLSLAKPGARLVAVVREQEVLDRLPHEPHDVAVHAALTSAGLKPLGATL